MTRDAEHTPAPQSVVLDTFNGDNAALVRSIAALLTMKNLTPPVPGLARQLLATSAARLAAAPAPSSLAGGEAESRALDWMEWVAQGALDTDDVQLSGAEIIQHAEIELASIRKRAALSPEAPAREGVDQAIYLKLIDTLKPFAEVAEKLKHCHVVEICEPTPDNPSRNIIPMPREWFERAADDLEAIAIQLHSDGVLSEGQTAKLTGLDRVEVRKQADALTPRHEAPAEPCKSCNGTGRELGSAFNRCADCEAPVEGAGEREGLIMALNIVTDPGIITGLRTAEEARSWIERSLQSALRARSSAPDALGNLLAVIHGDGGHRTLEVGVEQAAAEAEKIVANLLSSAPEAREGEVVAWACKTCNSPRAVDPCPKCGTELTKPADGWDWPRLPDIDRIRELAREVGYAVGVHGTLERDLDLIAVPWIAEAVTPFELAQHIASALGGNVLDYKTQDKPCGRWSCNINSDGWFKLIDVSVMPPHPAAPSADKLRIAVEAGVKLIDGYFMDDDYDANGALRRVADLLEFALKAEGA